jgi:hypothetical protein
MFCRLQAAIENYPGVYETVLVMCLRTPNVAWMAVRAISVLVLMFQPLAIAQQAEHDSPPGPPFQF